MYSVMDSLMTQFFIKRFTKYLSKQNRISYREPITQSKDHMNLH